MAMKSHVLIWVMTLYSDVVGYQHFRGSYCLCVYTSEDNMHYFSWIGPEKLISWEKINFTFQMHWDQVCIGTSVSELPVVVKNT